MFHRHFDEAPLRETGLDDDSLGSPLFHLGKGRVEFLRAPQRDRLDFDAEGPAGSLHAFDERLVERIRRIGQHGDPARRRQNLANEFEIFSSELRACAGDTR